MDEQAAANAALASDIANKDDPDTVLAIAKERMGLLESGRSFSTTRQIEKNAVGQREKKKFIEPRGTVREEKFILWS